MGFPDNRRTHPTSRSAFTRPGGYRRFIVVISVMIPAIIIVIPVVIVVPVVPGITAVTVIIPAICRVACRC